MESELISTLQEANQEIRSAILKWSETNVGAKHAAFPPGELQALSGKLAQVARRLRHLSPDQPKAEALQVAIGEYVSNLESLNTVLAGVQEALRKQRDHLKRDLAHTHSARAWMEAFRATHST